MIRAVQYALRQREHVVRMIDIGTMDWSNNNSERNTKSYGGQELYIQN
ncbi:hypothetical protein [Lapidilactobacillus salsurivasis]